MSNPRKTCEHGRTVCSQCVVVTDDAKRIADAITLANVFHSWEERATGWMAFALQDGGTDHTIYPSRQDAINHVPDENRYMFIALRTCPTGMPPKDAQLVLEMHREAFDAGFRWTEPEAPSLIFPIARGSGKWPK